MRAIRDVRRPLLVAAASAILLVALVEMTGTGASHSPSKLLLTTLMVAGSLMYFWVLADAVQQPRSNWHRVPITKPVWIFVLVVGNWVSLPLYLFYLKPRLDEGPESHTADPIATRIT